VQQVCMPGKCLTDLLGVPFKVHGRGKDGLDCWGLAMEVFGRYGVKLPDCWYDCLNDRTEIRERLSETVRYERIAAEKEPCLLLIKVDGNPCHVAVYIGEGYMIHATRRYGVAIEPIGRYRARIEGYYDVCDNQHI